MMELFAVMQDSQNFENDSDELAKAPAMALGFVPQPLNLLFHGDVEFRSYWRMIGTYVFSCE
jgi:hypothetical protein